MFTIIMKTYRIPHGNPAVRESATSLILFTQPGMFEKKMDFETYAFVYNDVCDKSLDQVESKLSVCLQTHLLERWLRHNRVFICRLSVDFRRLQRSYINMYEDNKPKDWWSSTNEISFQ